MSPAKVDIKAQGRELAEDLEIPRVALVSRPPAQAARRTELVGGPADHLDVDVATQGANEPVSPEAAPVSPEIAVDSTPAPSPSRSRAKVQPAFNPLEDLVQTREALVPLNVRVSAWVDEELEKRIYEMKMKRFKIKKEAVVQEAIIKYLGLTPPS